MGQDPDIKMVSTPAALRSACREICTVFVIQIAIMRRLIVNIVILMLVCIQSATAWELIDYSIASQPLHSALTEYAEQSDLQILFRSSELPDINVPLLKGKYTAEEAINRLLDKTGLEYLFGEKKTLVVRKRRSVLPAVDKQPQLSNDSSKDIESPHEETETVIDEILITARKREESLQDAPIAVTVFTQEMIEARGLIDISEVDDFTPNLEFNYTSPISAGNSAASVFIRGIGQLEWALPVDPGVGIYVDGVYIARSVGAVMDILDVERVEVLKGPQGTLFGRNTIGGAISITTREPHEEKEASASVTIGTDNRRDFKLFWNEPLTETVYINLSGSRRLRDGFVKNLASGAPDLGDDDVWAGRAALRWVVNDQLEFGVKAEYVREREAPAANVLLNVNEEVPPTFFPGIYNGLIPSSITRFEPAPAAVCATSNPARFNEPSCFNNQYAVGPFRTFSTHMTNNPVANTLAGRPAAPKSELDVRGVSLNAEWSINDNLMAKSISSFRELDAFWTRDIDHSPNTVFAHPNVYEQEQVTQELQLIGSSMNDRLDWILGFYFFREEGSHIDVVELPGLLVTSGGLVENKEIASFGQATYNLSESLDVTVGLRWTDETKMFTPSSFIFQDTISGFPAGTPIVPNTKTRIEADETLPYISASYRWNEDFMAYLSYTEGFKGGGFTQRVFPPIPEVQSFDPEFATSYEIGFKSTWLGKRVRLNGAVFYTDYEDLQVNTRTGLLGTATRNAAEAEIAGFEMELVATPIPGLVIEGGIGYLDAKYTELTQAAQNAGLSTDLEFVNTPEWSALLGISYRWHVINGWSLTPRIDISYRSEVHNDALNRPFITQGSYTLANTALSLQSADDKFTVTVRVTNLTDKEYLVTGHDATTTGSGVAEGVFGRPLQWALEFQYQLY